MAFDNEGRLETRLCMGCGAVDVDGTITHKDIIETAFKMPSDKYPRDICYSHGFHSNACFSKYYSMEDMPFEYKHHCPDLINSGKIYIAENDPSNRYGLLSLLNSAGFYDIITSTTGRHALMAIEKNPDLDLLISGNLPDIEGHELVMGCKANPNMAGANFIGLVERGHDSDYQSRLYNYLGAAVVSKPVIGQEFIDTVKSILKINKKN